MNTVNVAVIYCSKYGHTKRMAEAVLDGVQSFHKTGAVLLTAPEAAARLAELDSCDAIIFGSPTYMGSMAAEFKMFIEATVEKWFSRAWANKIAGGFTNSSNFFGDKENTLKELFAAAMQLGMIWVGVNDLPAANQPETMKSLAGPDEFSLNRVSASTGPMAASFSVKPDRAPGNGDLETARNYGRRIAEIATQFKRGAKKE